MWGSAQRIFAQRVALVLLVGLFQIAQPASAVDNEAGFVTIFDGETFDHWEGDQDVFRIEDGAIVGGTLSKSIPHNFFLRYEESCSDFELRLQFRLIGESTNAGIQIRSRRIPDHHEMIGYQADLGQTYWGCLYDESRRRRVLAGPDPDKLAKVLKLNDWNEYRIVCRGSQVRLWINEFQTVNYTEPDKDIPLDGDIALQIHGGLPGEAWYRNIRMRKL
ncbi:MAG: DUF1080 domain-containing protein [Fuerstiella sp.]|nr:DUF1080 domain-containing protein [Fuerstiella sp.]